MTLKKENDNSNCKGEDNNYSVPGDPSARDCNISLKIENRDKNEESTNNTNMKTYTKLPSSHGGEVTDLKKIDQPIIIKSLRKTLKRKADETPASLNPTKKHKNRVKDYINKINDQSLFITPTTPALSIPPDAAFLDEQADTNHPNNILATPPTIKRLIDTGNDVEEVTNSTIFTEHLEPVELDVPRLQEEKVNRGLTQEVINIQNNTYIDEDGKCLRMTDARDQVEIKRVVWQSIREPETGGKHDGESLESEGSENVTTNTNSEAVTDHADHTTEMAKLAQLKRTGHFNRITTSKLRINSNIEEKPVQSDRRCKNNTVQETKFQPDRKVPKNKMPKNKTTIQNPRKEKQIEDDNAKLGLAMKTWLEQKRSSQ